MASSFPLRAGTAEQCRMLTEFLSGARFTEPELMEAFGVESLNELLIAGPDERARLRRRIEQGGVQMLLAKLFLGGFQVRWQEAAGLIPAAIFEVLKAMGLYDDGGRCPVLFYPALGFFIASDRPVSSDGYGYGEPDFVMSALEHLSRTYVTSIGQGECGRFLEVGAGAGLGALCATRFAEEVWATDVTARSIACMEFNRALNGVSEEKMHIRCGDMYQPVTGMTFDRIACNPPFEPPLWRNVIYSVGGGDGEKLIERALREGVPMLNPGGRIYCQVLGTNRAHESFFARMCRWVEGTPVGVAYFERTRLSTDSYAAGQMMNRRADAAMLAEWDQFYGRLQATHFSTGHLIVERDAEFRFAQAIGEEAGPADMERRIEWDAAARKGGWEAGILDGRWGVGETCSLDVMRSVRNGQLVPVEYVLVCRAPFEVRMPVAAVVLDILKHAWGGKSGREIVDAVGAEQQETLDGMALCIGLGALPEKETA